MSTDRSTPSRSTAVTGSAGMLGRAVCDAMTDQQKTFEPLTRADCDLASPDSVRSAASHASDIWINCAAWTDVDGAEENETQALAVNGGPGLELLCQMIADAGGLLVHFSSDYVFNGSASEPYRIDHPIDPINAYGRTKAAGEAIIRESGCRHLIIRTSWLYAPWGNSFVRTIARLVSSRDELRVVDDQRGRPTSAQHLASATLALIDSGAEGTVHVCDGGEACTWFDFATEITRVLGSDCRILPCTSTEFPRPAPRPAYSVLDLSRGEAALGPMPDWRKNLARVLASLET